MLRSLHAFVSGKADGGDATLVRPSDWNASHKAASIVDTKTGNYTIADADNGEILRATGSTAQTFTLPAASGLVAGWSIIVENRNTGSDAAGQLTITRAGADTIDGLTSIYTWPGSVHLLYRASSSTWESLCLKGGEIEVTSTSGQTLNWPARCSIVRAVLWGAGGGGGAGSRTASAAVAMGGGGGGGGGYCVHDFRWTLLTGGTALTATCGAGGAGGTAATVDGNGGWGAAGGNSTLSASGLSTLYGFGGGPGSHYYGGGGGGPFSAATDYTQGLRQGRVGGAPVDSDGTGGYYTIGAPFTAIAGGAGGGRPVEQDAGSAGARSWFGGGGGGAGGGITTGNVTKAGGEGGATGAGASSNGGGGGSAGAAGGTAGGAGTAGPAAWGPGTAGGGGGSSTSGNGGAGGAGGRASGGGGGGCCRTGSTSGAGGAGGAGLIRLSYY